MVDDSSAARPTNKNGNLPQPTRPVGQHGHLSPMEVETLTEKIEAGIIAGYKPSFIYKSLGISAEIFWRLYNKRGERIAKERLRKTNALVATYLARTENLLNRLEVRYQKAEAEGDKREMSDLTRQIHDVIQQTADRLQSMGYLPKRVEKLDIREFDMRSWCWEALNGPKKKGEVVLKETKKLPQADSTSR